jgi:hypothetical protein
MYKKVTFLLLFSLLICNINAQQKAHNFEGDFSINFALAEPRGEFKNIVEGTPVGLNTSFAMGRTIKFGFSYTYLYLGGDRMRFSSERPGLFGNSIIERGTIRTASNANHFSLFTRLTSPTFNSVHLYLDALGGLSYFSTRTSLDFDFYEVNPQAERHYSDFGTIYGLRTGLKIRLHDDDKGAAIFLSAQVEYINGSRVTYGDPNSINIISIDEIELSEARSRSDFIVFSLGINFLLR